MPPPTADWWFSDDASDIFQSRRAEAVTPKTVQKIATAFACVDVLSKTQAMLPGSVYQKTSRGAKTLLKKHPVFAVLRRPNAVMDRFQFWQLKERMQLLRGNFYAQKMFNKYDQLVALHPINPDYVTPRAKSGGWDIEYVVNVPGQKERILSREEMFHTKEAGEDGIVGRSRIQIAYDAFKLALSHQSQNQAFAENDSRPMGILKPVQGAIKNKEDRDTLRESWENSHRGPRQSGRVAVLPFGVEYSPVSMTLRDAQALELMIFSAVDQINTIFDVPPYRTQDFRRATFSNVEQADIFWGKNSVLPRVIATECSIAHQLLSMDDVLDDIYIKFNLDAMFRTDIKTRYQAYRFAIQDGWLTRAEIRELEDWDPMEGHGLEEPMAPTNFTTAKGLLKIAEQPKQIEAPKKEDPKESKDESDEKLSKDRERLQQLLVDPVSRLVTKEKRALIKCLKKEKWTEELKTFSEKHRTHMRESLGASIRAFFGDAKNSGDLNEQINSIVECHLISRADEIADTLSWEGKEGLTALFESWTQPDQLQQTINSIVRGVENHE